MQIFCQQSMDEEDEEYNRTIVMTSEFRYGSLRNSEPVGTRLFLLRNAEDFYKELGLCYIRQGLNFGIYINQLYTLTIASLGEQGDSVLRSMDQSFSRRTSDDSGHYLLGLLVPSVVY